jgi:hypothetical protein
LITFRGRFHVLIFEVSFVHVFLQNVFEHECKKSGREHSHIHPREIGKAEARAVQGNFGV